MSGMRLTASEKKGGKMKKRKIGCGLKIVYGIAVASTEEENVFLPLADLHSFSLIQKCFAWAWSWMRLDSSTSRNENTTSRLLSPDAKFHYLPNAAVYRYPWTQPARTETTSRYRNLEIFFSAWVTQCHATREFSRACIRESICCNVCIFFFFLIFHQAQKFLPRPARHISIQFTPRICENSVAIKPDFFLNIFLTYYCVWTFMSGRRKK